MSSPPNDPKPNLPTIEITPPSPSLSGKNTKAELRDASTVPSSAQPPAASLPEPTPPASEQPAPIEDQGKTGNKLEQKRSGHARNQNVNPDLESHFEQLKKEFEETTGRSWIPLKLVTDDWDWYDSDEEDEEYGEVADEGVEYQDVHWRGDCA